MVQALIAEETEEEKRELKLLRCLVCNRTHLIHPQTAGLHENCSALPTYR